MTPLFLGAEFFLAMVTEIDFEEFLAIYKRIFVLSKSTVSDHVNDITRQPPKLIPAQHSKAGYLPCKIVATSLYIMLLILN